MERVLNPIGGSDLDAIARCLAESVGAGRVMLVGRSERRSVPHLLASWDGGEAAAAPPWTRGSLVGRAFEGSEPVVEHRRLDGEVAPAVAQIAVGVNVRGQTIAALYAGFEPPTDLDQLELRWRIESYGTLVALCLAGDPALSGRLATLGVDDLTGCLTYGGLVEALQAEVKRSQRHGHNLACCFIDIDDFKRVNDEHGHLEGNRVLAAVASALGGALRDYDTIGRFGGDEFVVILPETDGRALGRIAERLGGAARQAIAEETSTPMGVSLGIAEWDRSASPVGLLDAADRALAEAKERGNAVSIDPAGERRAGRLRAMVRGRRDSD